MTAKTYRTAQGKIVDMGALQLQNEMVRAVGNMGVNARGDRIDEAGVVIDERNRQIQRQVARQSNVVDAPVHTSTVTAKQSTAYQTVTPPAPVAAVIEQHVAEQPAPVVEDPVVEEIDANNQGLAAALARAKTNKKGS